jgi:hypothetical protein
VEDDAAFLGLDLGVTGRGAAAAGAEAAKVSCTTLMTRGISSPGMTPPHLEASSR